MTIRVLDALTTEGFWGAAILAGWNGLQRRVSGVTVAEVPDSANWLDGGEIVLTTGYLAHENPLRFVDWAEHLAKAGAAAIAVKRKRFLGEVPDEAVKLMDELGVPLISLRHRVSWPAIIGPVLQLQQALVGSDTFPRWKSELCQVIQEHRGFPALTGLLARQLSAPVLLHGGKLELRAIGIPLDRDSKPDPKWFGPLQERVDGNTVSRIRQQLQEMMSADNKDPWKGRHYTVHLGADLYETFAPLVNEERHVGYISFLSKGREVSKEAWQIRKYATALISLAYHGFVRRGDVQVSQNAQAFLDVITCRRSVADVPRPVKVALERVGFIVAVELGHSYPGRATIFHWEGQIQVVDTLLRDLQNWARSWDPAALVTAQEGIYYFLVPIEPAGKSSRNATSQRIRSRQRQWLSSLRSILRSRLGHDSIRVGISEVGHGIEFYQRAKVQADESLRLAAGRDQHVARHGAIKPDVVWFEDMGVLRLVSGTNPVILQDFVHQHLNPLRAEGDDPVDLLGTLQMYFECNGNLSEAARRLYIHRNTLRYRLKQISEKTGVDIFTSEGQATLFMAVRVAEFLSTGNHLGSKQKSREETKDV